MSDTTPVTIHYTFIPCYKCGIVFGWPTTLDTQRRADGRKFFCPNGHEQVFNEGYERRKREKNPDYERQQEQLLALHKLEQAEARAEAAEEQAKQLAATMADAPPEPTKAKHNPAAAPGLVPETFRERETCPVCGKEYRSSPHFWRHLRHVHGLNPSTMQPLDK